MKEFYFKCKDKKTNQIKEVSTVAKNIIEAENNLIKNNSIIVLEFTGWQEVKKNDRRNQKTAFNNSNSI